MGPVREGKVRTAPHGARAGPVSGRKIFVQNSLWTAREQPVWGPGVWCDRGITTHHQSDVIMSVMASQLTDVSMLNRFRRRSKKTSKLRVNGICEGNSPVTGEFPFQKASNAKNVSIW